MGTCTKYLSKFSSSSLAGAAVAAHITLTFYVVTMVTSMLIQLVFSMMMAICFGSQEWLLSQRKLKCYYH